MKNLSQMIMGMLAMGVVTALPAAAEAPDPHAILADYGKIVSANGVDEAKAIEIGGIQQWITVRGRDRANPILLVIHGGPAAPDLPNRYLYEPSWADYFTVVQWDQRGGGKTFELNDPDTVAPTLSKERMIQDAQEVVAYLRTNYGKQKIFVLGHSWGSLVGLSLAERKPEWLYAYIGVGQIIDMHEGEKISYEWTLNEARKAGNQQAINELTAIAPYPETDGSVPLDKLGTERKWSIIFGGLIHGRKSYDTLENTEKISPDYTETDFKAIDQGSAFTLPKLLPDLMSGDFTKVKKLNCPVLMFAGRYDYTTPSVLVKRWFDGVEAPSKRFVWFENSAHMIYEEEPGRFLVHLVQDALPLAAAQRPGHNGTESNVGEVRKLEQ
jgi:pimeloyl-ACP methyl ester carboxylesterase